MIWLMLLLVTTVVVGGARAALRRGGAEVNHVVLFSFGVGFYWVLPIVAGMIRIPTDQAGIVLWYATWDTAERSGGMASFAAFTLIAYLAFLAGDWMGGRLRSRSSGSSRELMRDPRLLRLFFPPAVAITAVYAWLLRSQLFAGYRGEYSDTIGFRGTLSASSLLLLVLCLLRASESARWPRQREGWRGLITDPFLIAYAVSAVLVLSLGGRLYVASAVIMAVVYHSVFHRPIPIVRAATIALVAMGMAGVAGTIRLGSAPSPLGVMINLVSEPLFTSFSLLHFIAQDNIPWITAPRLLLSDLLNLVPTAVLPTKAEYLLRPADLGYSIFSPLGALNSYVSFMINFGRIGTPIVLFLLGGALAVLKRQGTALTRVIYSMLSGWIAFTFFRDPFSIAVVKNMIEFSVLMPVLIVWSVHVMTVIAPRSPLPVRMNGLAQ